MIYSENILLCIALPLLIVCCYLRGNVLRFVIAFLVGMVACLISSYISGFFGLLAGSTVNETAVYISPLVEEMLKLLPLLFYFFVFLPNAEDMVRSAVAIGAGFATFENCCYLLLSGAENLTYTLIRGLAVGVMHIVCMLALTLGLILVRRFRVISLTGVVGAMTLSMTFHGLYNLLVSVPGVSSWIGYVLPLLTAILLFYPYRAMTGIIKED